MPGSPVELLIYDFDGVIAETELVANTVLAEALTEAGLPTTLEQALDIYLGKSWGECTSIAERTLGRPLPDNFARLREECIIERLKLELVPVDGVQSFISSFAGLKRCIASSSSPEWLAFCLDRLSLSDHFAGYVFSTRLVERGKPAPDIFLYAAAQMGIGPNSTVVLEDSTTGVQAAAAAGMTVIGICAGKHIRDGHAQRLRDAGADFVVPTFQDAADVIRSLADRVPILRI